ncbi:MAG: Gfo/Idh/MocA family oxidoreductase [Spirochaetia bacterium]
MEKIMKVGIIGTGIMGRRHAEVYSTLEGVELAAIADPCKEKLEEVGKAFGVAGKYSDYHDLLASKEIDAVSICTPDHLHREPAIDSAEAKKDILLEKPIATSIEDAEAILASVKKNKVKLMVGFSARFMKPFDHVKAKILEGDIGEPLCARLEWYNRSDSYTRADLTDGVYPPKRDSILTFLGSHPIDLLIWYFGAVERVYCEADTFTWGRDQGGPFDSAIITLRFKSGAMALVQTLWSTGGTPFRVRLELELLGRNGMIQCSSLDESFKIYSTSKGYELPISYDWRTGVTKELKYFIECIRQKNDPMITGEMALETLKVTLAADRSARENRAIAVG